MEIVNSEALDNRVLGVMSAMMAYGMEAADVEVVQRLHTERAAYRQLALEIQDMFGKYRARLGGDRKLYDEWLQRLNVVEDGNEPQPQIP